MSTYRTSMMLYSSVLALSLVAASDGFCAPKSESASSAEKTSELKEKSREQGISKSAEVKVAADSKKSSDTGTKAKKDIVVVPLSEAEEDADEKQKRKAIEQAQKKANFAKKVDSVFAKYSALLSSISAEDSEVIAQKLKAHNEKVRATLLDALAVSEAKPEDTIFSKLRTKLKEREIFISSKEQSIGKEDKEFFKEVHAAAEKQIKRLEKLHAEYLTHKGNLDKQKETQLIYADKLNNFLASYGMFTASTHYLASAKTYCNDSAISFNNMKVQFPEFSSKAFKEAAVPADILSGKRDPFASIKGYRFYAIGKDEYQNGKFLSQIPAESDDAKFIVTAKGAKNSQILLSPENGGLILSSQMIQKEGMDRPVCVFSSYAADGGKETVYRFSLVHESEEAAGKQLTAQLIQAEAQPERSKLVEAVAELKVAFKKEKDPKASSKSAQKAADKDEKTKDKTAKDGDKTEKKVDKAKADVKPKATDDDDKPKAKGDDKPKAKDDDKPKAKDDDKPKVKDDDKPKAKDDDKSTKKALNKEIEEAAGKTKTKAAKEAKADDKTPKKAGDDGEKTESKVVKDGDKPKRDKSSATESADKPKAKTEEATNSNAGKKDETPKEEPGFFGKLFSSSKGKEETSAKS